jgi:cell division control protein 45
MYQKILSDHRRSRSSATSVTILVAPNVDALCAARIFATLFKQDDVAYCIIPVSGRIELEKVADELRSNSEVRAMVKFD